MSEQPISPYDLVQHYEDHREQRKEDFIKVFNTWLIRQTGELLKFGQIRYLNFSRNDLDLLPAVLKGFTDIGWNVTFSEEEMVITFLLPGKILNGNGTNGDTA